MFYLILLSLRSLTKRNICSSYSNRFRIGIEALIRNVCSYRSIEDKECVAIHSLLKWPTVPENDSIIYYYDLCLGGECGLQVSFESKHMVRKPLRLVVVQLGGYGLGTRKCTKKIMI